MPSLLIVRRDGSVRDNDNHSDMITNGKKQKIVLGMYSMAIYFFLCKGDNWPTIVVLKKR